MKKIDGLSIFLNIQEPTPESDKTVTLHAEYRVSDDFGMAVSGAIDLKENIEDLDRLLINVYGAINAKEGTSYNPKIAVQPGLAEEELALIECYKKRLAEYPTPQEYLAAEYDARIKGDKKSLQALDERVAAVKRKYPKPNQVNASIWKRVKAFFGH